MKILAGWHFSVVEVVMMPLDLPVVPFHVYNIWEILESSEGRNITTLQSSTFLPPEEFALSHRRFWLIGFPYVDH